MLKKIILSTLLVASTLVSAQCNLDLTLTITHGDTEQQSTGSVVVDENEVTSIVFNGLEALVIDVLTQVNEGIVTLETQFSQQMTEDDLVPVTDWLGVQVKLGQAANITVTEPDNTGSLVLTITPSLVE
jgi:hypothetical protein